MKNSDDRGSPSAESRQLTATPALPHLRQLLDDYLRMYANRDDRLTTYFSKDFSGFTGGGDFLVKDLQEWVAITRLDFSQVKDALRLELKDTAIQSLSETIAVATSFFTIHLPIKDHILSRETARLVLIFRQESEGWKITHSSISIPYQGVRTGEVYPLQDLVKRNRFLEEQVAERTAELSNANDNLNRTNEEFANEIAEHERTALQLHELLTSRTQELREATAAALRAGADEEDRIGKELHDNLCPDLIGLARQAETLADGPTLAPHMRDPLRDLAAKASAAARRARNLSHLLARPDFTHANFSELLHAQLNHLENTLGLTCELTLDDAFPSLGPERSGHLIRIVREAVVNAARHAGARRIWVDCVRFGNRATICISNDGSPLPPPETLTTGLGLRQMRMRADQLEATLALHPGQAGGAVVELTLSLPANELNFDPSL
jgi:signal transduction histidine kinase